MIRAMAGFTYMLPTRLKAIWKLVKDPVLSRSYYPQRERKSTLRQLVDNLWYLARHQEVDYEYHYHGMDGKAADASEHLLPRYGVFHEMRDKANAAANAAATVGDIRNRQLSYQMVLADKFVFGQYLTGLGIRTPEILAIGDSRTITWLDEGRRCPLESLLERNVDGFFKEALGDGGTRVFTLRVEKGRVFVDDEEESLDELRRRIEVGGHYIIQERVRQHPRLSELCPDSLNTVRLITMVLDGSPTTFGAVLRMGTKGSSRDTWSTGGVAVGIDLETGCLMKSGFFSPKCGTRVERHPDTGVVFEGFEVPHFLETVETAQRLHGYFYGFQSIGWDIGITPDGPSFVEGNDDWGLQSLQGPLGGLRKRFMAMVPG